MLNQTYSTCFGYTEEEIKYLLQETDLFNSLTQVKEWYNGYRIHKSTLYNP